jgi:predicted nucleic acid-binding protein
VSNALFLDASGWFAAMAPNQLGHVEAAREYVEAATTGRALVTTTLVIAEVHALVLRWRGAQLGSEFLDSALDAKVHRIVAPDAELIDAAVKRWIRGYAGQPFSLCDAVSFEVMRRQRIRRVLTLDRHFEVAGFERVSRMAEGR